MEDGQRFEELFSASRRQFFATALLQTRNYHDAEDVFQDAALLGYRYFHKLKNPAYFKTWMTRILINCAHRQFRKNRAQSSDELAAIAEGLTADLANWEEHILLFQALDQLDDKTRTLFHLRYFADLTVPEIAQVLHLPQGTVKSRLSRGLEKLKTSFKEADKI